MSEEPVAYLQLDIHGNEMVHIEKDMGGYETKPLYTKEQLQPKVKMTKKLWVEFDRAFGKYQFIHDLYVEHNEMFKNILTFAEKSPENEKQLLYLWASYDSKNPEETIEIVPEKKWFVRSKSAVNGVYLFLSDITHINGHWYQSDKENDVGFSFQFDTKEEAELWTNPLTKAVLLPVEGE